MKRHAPLCLYVIALLWLLPQGAQAQRGVYSTRETTTTTSSTDATTGVTTTRTVTERDGLASRDRPRDTRTSDIDARYPYDASNGTNRSDVDAVRSGFDDPRNPWDGRYTNDNPRNSANSPGSNAAVNSMRGEPRYSNDRYRPGNFGTRRARD